MLNDQCTSPFREVMTKKLEKQRFVSIIVLISIILLFLLWFDIFSDVAQSAHVIMFSANLRDILSPTMFYYQFLGGQLMM